MRNWKRNRNRWRKKTLSSPDLLTLVLFPGQVLYSLVKPARGVIPLHQPRGHETRGSRCSAYPSPGHVVGPTATALCALQSFREGTRNPLHLACSPPGPPTPPLSTPDARAAAFWSEPHTEGKILGGTLDGGGGLLGGRGHSGAAYLYPLVRGPKIQNKTMLDEPKGG